ncbi:hypothetical protein D3C72_2208830 [compost metagenome]
MVEEAGGIDVTLGNGFLQPMLVHRLTEIVTQEITTAADELPGFHYGGTRGGVAGREVFDQHLIGQLQRHADLAQHRQYKRIER